VPNRDSPGAAGNHAEAVRRAFAAALNGDFETVRGLLADDVRWYGAGGDPSGGCTNRAEAMRWMGEIVARGVRAEVHEVRALDANRVLVRLQRKPPGGGAELPEPHAQIVTFRGEEVSEIVVYPSEEEALRDARSR
jgi:ketosteroid isomerase-like protein